MTGPESPSPTQAASDGPGVGEDTTPAPGGDRRDAASLRAERDLKDVDRLVFFSDAVFAIALTLLVFDLRLPELAAPVTSGRLADALIALWPKAYSFTLSFVVVLFYWYGHFRMFRVIRRVDTGLVVLDALLLFFVVVIPFPTSVMGAYPDLAPAVILYGFILGMAGLLSALLWVYAARWHRLVDERVTSAIVHRMTVRAAVAPAIILVSTPITLVAPLLTQVIWVFIVPLQELVARVVGSRAR